MPVMKRAFYVIIVLAVIAGSFWAGSQQRRREAVRVDPSPVKSSPVNLEERMDNEVSSLAPGTIEIGPMRQQAIGLQVGTGERNPIVYQTRILGRIAADDTRIYRINASVDGWIKDVRSNSVGSIVRKNEILATFYSPAFLDAQQGYLYALGTVERLGPARRLELGRQETPNTAALDPYVVQRQIDVLRGMGMSDSQIEEVGRTREFTQNIQITAPADGFVIARNISPGERFLKGTEFYKIADLSRVWVLADVFEQEAQYFKAGDKAIVHLPYQKKSFQAIVSKVLPIFDPGTRTLKVRLETANPGFVLRPDMFVNVELPVTLPSAITVPSDAVLDSGLRKRVFVDRGNGYFEPRDVETGWRLGNRVEIVKGLVSGERIVMSGNFLIDSESRLQTTAAEAAGALVKDPVCGKEVSINKGEKPEEEVFTKGQPTTSLPTNVRHN